MLDTASRSSASTTTSKAAGAPAPQFYLLLHLAQGSPFRLRRAANMTATGAF